MKHIVLQISSAADGSKPSVTEGVLRMTFKPRQDGKGFSAQSTDFAYTPTLQPVSPFTNLTPAPVMSEAEYKAQLAAENDAAGNYDFG